MLIWNVGKVRFKIHSNDLKFLSGKRTITNTIVKHTVLDYAHANLKHITMKIGMTVLTKTELAQNYRSGSTV